MKANKAKSGRRKITRAVNKTLGKETHSDRIRRKAQQAAVVKKLLKKE